MQVTPTSPPAKQIVERYGPGGFRINGATYTTPVLILPDRVEPWSITSFEAMNLASLNPILTHKEIEVLIIGSGQRMRMISTDIKAALKAVKISADVMDTGAACRTYSVLILEGRRVAAALIPSSLE